MIRPELLNISALDRLRWKVLCAFGVLPGSRLARQMSDEDVIFAGLNMVLDLNAQAPESGFSAFDMDRFSALKESEGS